MSMTVEEAIRRLQDHFRVHDDGRPTPHLDEAVSMAISALEEVQKLHEIGTVSEFRELKEKATGKKPIETDWLYCPNCNATLLLGEKHCICGQKLDWSEGKE